MRVRYPWHGTDLREVQTGTVTAVVVVAVHVKDFLALDGQETRKDTFGQTGTENDDLWARWSAATLCAMSGEGRTSYSSSMAAV